LSSKAVNLSEPKPKPIFFLVTLCRVSFFFFTKVEFVRPLNLKSIQNDQREIGLGLGLLKKNLQTPIWVKT